MIKFVFNRNLIKTNNIDVIDRERYSEIRYINNKEVDVKISRYTISQSLNFQSKDVKTTEEKISQIKLSLVSENLTSNIYSNYSWREKAKAFMKLSTILAICLMIETIGIITYSLIQYF